MQPTEQTSIWKMATYSNKNYDGILEKHENLSSRSYETIIFKSKRSDTCIRKIKPFLGLLYIASSSVFLTLTSLFGQQLAYVSVGQLAMTRHAGVFAGCVPIAIYCVRDVLGPRNERLLMIGRAVITGVALYLYVLAFSYLPLAEAAVVLSTTPAVTSVMARFYLKEPLGRVQIVALPITFCGALLFARFPDILRERENITIDDTYVKGLISAAACVVMMSLNNIIVRKLKGIHFSALLIYVGFVGVLLNGSVTALTSKFVLPHCGWDSLRLLLIGIFGFFGHCFLVLAYQSQAAGIAAILEAAMDIMFAIFFQFIFFSINLDVYKIVGACLTIVSLGIIEFRNWLITLPEDSNARKRFMYLLT